MSFDKNSAIEKRKYVGLYIIAFIFITVIGSMISRTTSLGAICAFVYLLYVSRIYTLRLDSNMAHIYVWFAGILVAMILLISYGYSTNLAFRENLRFGFEGFFSFVEEGKWDVHSNEMLRNMYIFPDNLKTWIIGDGYFDNPCDTDPYYTGHRWVGYYQNTDVGYLRFIYYFGVAGLIAFSLFMIKTGKVCMNRFTSYRSLFLLFCC